MIKIRSQEKIGRSQKGFVSFMLKFVDEKLHEEEIEDLEKKLLKYESYLRDDSSFEYYINDINADDKIVINIIIHYPAKKWPFEEQRDVKLINDFADDFVKFYKNEIASN